MSNCLTNNVLYSDLSKYLPNCTIKMYILLTAIINVTVMCTLCIHLK